MELTSVSTLEIEAEVEVGLEGPATAFKVESEAKAELAEAEIELDPQRRSCACDSASAIHARCRLVELRAKLSSKTRMTASVHIPLSYSNIVVYEHQYIISYVRAQNTTDLSRPERISSTDTRGEMRL